MNITPQQKKIGVLVGILVILGGGAFVYLDPLELDLLGLNPPPPVKPAPKPPVKAPAPKPAAPAAASAPVATTAPVAAPVSASAPVQAVVQAASSPVAASAKAPAQPSTPSMKPQVTPPPASKQEPKKVTDKPVMGETMATSKTAPSKFATNKPERPKDLDLRHCLELQTNAEIAKCAGE